MGPTMTSTNLTNKRYIFVPKKLLILAKLTKVWPEHICVCDVKETRVDVEYFTILLMYSRSLEVLIY